MKSIITISLLSCFISCNQGPKPEEQPYVFEIPASGTDTPKTGNEKMELAVTDSLEQFEGNYTAIKQTDIYNGPDTARKRGDHFVKGKLVLGSKKIQNGFMYVTSAGDDDYRKGWVLVSDLKAIRFAPEGSK